MVMIRAGHPLRTRFARFMQRATRYIAVGILPVLALALGWQLGTQFERTRLLEMRRELDMLFDVGGTQSGRTIADPEREVSIEVLWSVWRLLLAHYIEPDELKADEMLEGAVHGLVEAVGDPYTSFMSPQENKDFRQALSGHLQGIGAELALRGGQIVIVAPLRGSPAEKAGLRPEDVILTVDGEAMTGKSLQDAVQKIRGQKGTSVKLGISRAESADPIEVTIVRDDISIPSTQFEEKKTGTGSVGVVSINQFGAETAIEVEKILRENVAGKPLKGLIVDLRYNGGGYLEGAVQLSSMFMRQGRVVTVERRDAGAQHHDVDGQPITPDIPMVVLINEGSASASEILAGALQDNKRATIVGMKSFGKGTVQEVIDLPGGSSLRVTIARWKTPKGKDLGKEGVHPDIVVDLTQADADALRDPQLEAALEWLLDKEDVTKTQPKRFPPVTSSGAVR
jgi:carboxyl-terminal processing protease